MDVVHHNLAPRYRVLADLGCGLGCLWNGTAGAVGDRWLGELILNTTKKLVDISLMYDKTGDINFNKGVTQWV